MGVTSAHTLTKETTQLTGAQKQLYRELQPEPEPYLDGCDGEGDLPPSINVRVEDTKNVLELFRNDQRLK